ncbi:MAG: ABC transporter permease subunit, partial [Oscillospiraceae bacterium]|nr:ABC transporter permease subunit [Oscillospiraceae bacterium]
EDIGGTPVYYSEMSAAIEDLRRNRIDGYMTDESIARVFDSMPGNEDIMLIDVPAEVFAVQQGAISMSPEVIDRFNVFLAKIRADGTLNEMRGRWLETVPDLDAPMPNIPLTGENGTLQVVTSGVAMPFSFFGAENQLKGFCIEMAYRFAAHEGMDIEFSTVDFSGFIPYVISGRADIGIDALFITEERKQSVLFSEPYAEDRVAILTLRHSAEDRAAILTLRHSNDSGRNGDTVLDYRSFAGKRIGHKTGTIWDQIIEGPLNAVAEYYSDMSAGVEDIRMNRIDGFIADLSAVRVLVAMQENQDLINVEVPAEIFSAPMAAVSLNQDIIDRFNVFLASVEADGTLEDMQNRWLNTVPDLDSPMPEIISIGTNGTLLVATSAGSMPFAYMGAGNELKGYSIELVYRFAAHEGMVIEFSEMDFGAMIPYIVSGRADLAIADISITEERKLSVSFTDPIYYDQGGIIALRPSDTTVSDSGGGFISWLITGVERNLITDNRWEMIVNGLGTTMLIALMAQIFGTVFGCFVCYVLTRKSKLAQWFGNFYCGLIRGTPAVVLLMITYYIIFGGTRIPGVVVAIAAFTMVTGASIAQILKGAIETVDPVEIEAARSLGFPAFKAFLTVTLPQAVRRALPAYTNGFVELVKATAIVGFIAIQDLTRAGDIIRSRTYDAYFPLLFIAVIYLIVTMICVQLFKLIVKKVSGGVSG